MRKSTLFYISVAAALVVGLWIILTVGGHLRAPAGTAPAASTACAAAAGHAVGAAPLLVLFLQIALIVAASRAAGWVFARFHQPQVMGEMIAGILLGPSLFGWVAPHAWQFIFPGGSGGASVQYLNILSQVGVVFFLFLIGLELDPRLLRNRGGAALIISHMSIVAPFLLGAGLTLYLYPRIFEARIPFTSAALFMGAAMSITAFPVLARILTERNLQKTNIGAITITCAAVDDVTAWCMLACVVAVARAHGWQEGLWTALLSGGYVLIMFLVVRPFLGRLELIYERHGRLSQNIISIIFLLILASAYTTETIGIHALFGAFLMGAIFPKGSQFVRHLSEKLEDFTVVFLLPIFFAYTGLRTQIGLIDSRALLLDTLLVIFVACLGKFGGSAVAARVCGLSWREASAIGVLMNTRGLMELVILNVGRELGVITDSVFAIMVLMALTTTALTTPILHWVFPRRLHVVGGDGAAALAKPPGYSVLIPVSLPKSGGPLVQIADTLIGDRNLPAATSRVYALHLRHPADREAFRTGLDEAEDGQDDALVPLLAQARARGLPVEPVSFVSRDIAEDIARVARERHVNLVLIGFHQPVIGKTILGGTVHRILSHAEADVAIFVDRGFRQARRILVPYLGSPHDRLAMELASRMATHTDAQVTVLHVVPPLRGDASRTLNVKTEVDRVFNDPTQPAPVMFRVVEDISPVGVVLHQAQNFDLVVIGVAEEWGLESHLFGWRAERIARDCPSSMLIVRKFGSRPAVAANS